MKLILLSALSLAFFTSALRADDPAVPPKGVFRIVITRVTASRDLFPLAFPTPSRVGGILDELAVVERNAARDHVKITLTRFSAVMAPAGVPAVIVTGRETPDAPAEKRLRPPVYRNRVIVTVHLNADGSLGGPCRLMDTRPDPDFGAVVGVPPTIKNEAVSVLRQQSADTRLIEAESAPGQPSRLYYATVTALLPGAFPPNGSTLWSHS